MSVHFWLRFFEECRNDYAHQTNFFIISPGRFDLYYLLRTEKNFVNIELLSQFLC